MPHPQRLLVWTENYWVGGCDRFLVDLLAELRHAPVSVALAGNPHPAFDRWLASRAPWLGPRTIVPVANLVHTPLHRLDRLRPGPGPAAQGTGPTPERAAGPEPLAWRAPAAALRYGQAALNLTRLRRALRRAAPDVVLINNGGYPGGESCRVAAIAARQAGVPRIVEFVHNMAHPPAWPVAAERALDRHVDAAVDQWVTAATRASAELAAQRGFEPARVATVHYGLPSRPAPPAGDPGLRASLRFHPDTPGLAVIANLEPRKGLGVLLQSLAHLRANGLRLPAVIVGEGPERTSLQAMIDELGLGRSVQLLGWRDDVDEILACSDLLALPSLANECLPYVILEAMEHGLPVVSTDVAGIPEMVTDGDTGYVVPPGEPSRLADALARVATDPGRRAAMGQRGRERQQSDFTAGRMARAVAQLLGLAPG